MGLRAVYTSLMPHAKNPPLRQIPDIIRGIRVYFADYEVFWGPLGRLSRIQEKLAFYTLKILERVSGLLCHSWAALYMFMSTSTQ